MNLKQLTYFVALAKNQNFTTAANELFICQSALSKTIKAMEEDLNVQLVDRTAKQQSDGAFTGLYQCGERRNLCRNPAGDQYDLFCVHHSGIQKSLSGNPA